MNLNVAKPHFVLRMVFKLNFKVVLAFLSYTLATFAQDGTLDNTFGNGGVVIPSFTGSNSTAISVVVQDDQKIVTAGTDFNGLDSDFLVMRFNMDGSVDNTFGVNGVVTTDISNGEDDKGLFIVLQSDGKMLVAGSTGDDPNTDFALLRYNTDGSLDNTFGNNGIAITAIENYSSVPYSIAIQDNGKIVVAGACIISPSIFRGFALARYNMDGSLDTSFDLDGIVTTSIGDYASANSVTIQPDGKILAGGVHRLNTFYYYTLIRYNLDGSLDSSLDNDGIILTTLPNAGGFVRQVKVTTDNKILTVGANVESFMNSVSEFIIARYEMSGVLDNSFNNIGVVNTAFVGSSGSTAAGVIVQQDGKILVVGTSPNNFLSQITLTRYLDDGSLDNTFDIDGIVTTPLQTTSFGNSIALQDDGKIVIACNVFNGSFWSASVVRYNNSFTSSVSESSLTKDEIFVYPNPIQETVTVDSKNLTLSEISIMNSAGEIVLKTTMENGFKTIILTDLSSGIYFLKVENEQQFLFEKLIKK